MNERIRCSSKLYRILFGKVEEETCEKFQKLLL